MSTPVVTVAAGGLPVVELAAGQLGLPVTEATNGRGIAVTKVVGMPGLPVVFDTIGVLPPVTGTTFDPTTVTAVTLSGGNLVATNTATGYCGVRVATASGKTAGKFYYEETITTRTGGNDNCVGIGTPTSAYSTMGSNGTTGVVWFPSGSVYANGALVSSAGGWVQGDILGVAVDMTNRKIWFRKSPAGIWNGSGTDNPATNTGGFVVPAGTMVPFAVFGGAGGVAGNVFTANFGASAFSGAVPAGFTSGWLP